MEKQTYSKPQNSQKTLELTDSQILDLVDTKTETDDKGVRRQLIFASGIRYRWNPKKEAYEVSILDYHRDGVGELQIKFPGGCSEVGEGARQTSRREMITETGRALKSDAHILHYDPILAKGGSTIEHIEHIKVFFEQEVPFTEKTPFLKTVTGSDNRECGPVYYAEINQDLIKTMFRSHKTPLIKLIRKLQDGIKNEKDEVVRRKKIQSLILTL